MPEASLDAIQQAAQLAHADAFIHALPQGYRTPLGENGLRLSGGQAQRIALARAFLRDTPLVILDEPTAHLDPALQTQLDESIRRLMAGRTALIIAHRLESVRRADQAIVLEAGRVVEAGSPEALRAAQGPFAQLAAAGGTA
jgi:ATP-binding cassette subfamily C protein CydD